VPAKPRYFALTIFNSGRSFRKVLKAVRGRGVTLIEPLMVVGNFAGKSNFDGFRVEALFEREIELWDEARCPLCARGSKAVPARRQWDELTSGI
jgi:hypothetical protein